MEKPKREVGSRSTRILLKFLTVIHEAFEFKDRRVPNVFWIAFISDAYNGEQVPISPELKGGK